MPDLIPYPFPALVRRAFRELERGRSIFDLPEAKFFLGDEERDFSVRFHGLPASSPLGPAAGPQTQMAQNIVLSWLGGCRIMELKTVQILDELAIPRPCIDMETVGFNVEWSQELKLEESLDEYVKGAMLVEMLRSGPLTPRTGFDRVLYDLSVGYDLEGIRSERVGDFIRGMLDAGETVERFRRQIPDEFAPLRELDYPNRLAETVTLSTFHGCPPAEIERIIDFLMREHGLHSVVKFNPTLLGPERVRELLHDRLGYGEIHVPGSAFEKDASWEQAVEIMERLGETAGELGLGLGAKFSNTLIVHNQRGFLAPEEQEAYLSGQPLHVLAMNLVRRFRRTFGDRFPISFAAGIDRGNFADAVALGLTPITVCSDLLQKGGYGRLSGYYGQLQRRMKEVAATDVDSFILRAYGQGEAALDRLGLDPDDPVYLRCRQAFAGDDDPEAAAGEGLYRRWVDAATLLNTEVYVEKVNSDERYSRERNSKTPKKIGRHLKLFDCLTCDLCVPVCPNDANFTLAAEDKEIPVVKVERENGGWRWRREDAQVLTERHQIANFVDFCNDCGNCDIFCPEDGGPYKIKPRFFGSETAWQEAPELDGFFVERGEGGDRILGRFDGSAYHLEVDAGAMTFSGDGFKVNFKAEDPEATLEGEAEAEVDLTYCHIMDYLRRAVLDPERVNYVNSQVEEGTAP